MEVKAVIRNDPDEKVEFLKDESWVGRGAVQETFFVRRWSLNKIGIPNIENVQLRKDDLPALCKALMDELGLVAQQ